MNAVTSQPVISQVNKNMLSKIQNQNPPKIPSPVAPKPNPEKNLNPGKNNENKGDYITIAGKTIEKKKAIIGAAAILTTIIGLVLLIKKGLKKGVSPSSPSKGKTNTHKIEPKKRPNTGKSRKTRPNRGSKNTSAANKRNSSEEILKPKAEIAPPKKTAEQIQAEIEAEAKRRTLIAQREAEAVERENAYIEKTFGIKPDGTRVPPEKSARESALFMKQSSKLDEKVYSKMSDEVKSALGGDFKDFLTVTVPSTNGSMKQMVKNAAMLETEFTPKELEQLANSGFHIKVLLGEYLKGISDSKEKKELIDFLRSTIKLS